MNASLSVSVNLSSEFTNFIVELSLLIKVVDKLLDSKCQFNTINTIINSFHHSYCLIEIFCSACNPSDSSFNWYSFFDANGSSSSNDWLRILANIRSNLHNIIDNDLSLIPELFPFALAFFFCVGEFWSDGNNGLITRVNSLSISISKCTQNLVLNLGDLSGLEGCSHTLRLVLGWSELISLHDTIRRCLGLLADISIRAPDVAISLRAHAFTTFLGEPVIVAVIVGGAGFTMGVEGLIRLEWGSVSS